MTDPSITTRIPKPTYDAIVEAFRPDLPREERERIVADVLAAAEEYAGIRLPRSAFVLNPEATVKAFPGGVPALTTKGLADFYRRRGWRFFILRVDQLIRAFIGQNERIQEVLALYEARCEADGVSAVPPWADGFGVAGGERQPSPFSRMVEAEEAKA